MAKRGDLPRAIREFEATLKLDPNDARNTVLFVGFQAAGTRGRRLVEGEQAIPIHGQMIPVHARIEQVESMSAHADSIEILHWLEGFASPPRLTFIVHGEVPAMETLSGTIQARLGWNTKMPAQGETVQLA